MLGYYNSKDHPRDSSANAIKVELKAVRPDPDTPLEENRYAFFFIILLCYTYLFMSKNKDLSKLELRYFCYLKSFSLK